MVVEDYNLRSTICSVDGCFRDNIAFTWAGREDIEVLRSIPGFADLNTTRFEELRDELSKCIFHTDKENELWIENWGREHEEWKRRKDRVLRELREEQRAFPLNMDRIQELSEGLREILSGGPELDWRDDRVGEFWRLIRRYRDVEFREGYGEGRWGIRREDTYNFSGFSFPEFEGMIVQRGEEGIYIALRTTNFWEEGERLKFYLNASFSEAAFSGNAYFSEATFSGDANFWDTTFSDYADFRIATFLGYADFWDATFSRDANFSNATFLGNADFWEAAFSGKADFRRVTFSRDANASFSGAMFSRYAYFSGAKFLGNVVFLGATFSGDANFSGATFSGYADLRRATFSRNAYFSGATFSRDANFSEATFSRDAYFSNITLSSTLSFRENTCFHSALLLENVRFQTPE